MAEGYLQKLVANVVAQTGRTPLELAQEFGKSSPELIAAMNNALPNDVGYITASQQTGQIIGAVASGVLPVIVPALKSGGNNVNPAIADMFVGALTNIAQETYGSQMLQAPVPAPVGAGGVVAKILQGIAGGIASGVTTAAITQGGTAAPKAGLITGSCPPGLVRRNVAWGRDICVKPRRMNPLNPSALRRATSRISRFHQFAQATEKQMAKAFRKGGFHVSSGSSSRSKCGTCKKARCSCR